VNDAAGFNLLVALWHTLVPVIPKRVTVRFSVIEQLRNEVGFMGECQLWVISGPMLPLNRKFGKMNSC